MAERAGVRRAAGSHLTGAPHGGSFGRATGQPWWVAASTVGAEIDLLPLAELRRRGTLESTVRQEVAHVVLDAALPARPVWVREGAAMYFSGRRPGRRSRRGGRCPADAELLRPVSGGAEREAFGRAERCFRRQIAGGTRWTDLR